MTLFYLITHQLKKRRPHPVGAAVFVLLVALVLPTSTTHAAAVSSHSDREFQCTYTETPQGNGTSVYTMRCYVANVASLRYLFRQPGGLDGTDGGAYDFVANFSFGTYARWASECDYTDPDNPTIVTAINGPDVAADPALPCGAIVIRHQAASGHSFGSTSSLRPIYFVGVDTPRCVNSAATIGSCFEQVGSPAWPVDWFDGYEQQPGPSTSICEDITWVAELNDDHTYTSLDIQNAAFIPGDRLVVAVFAPTDVQAVGVRLGPWEPFVLIPTDTASVDGSTDAYSFLRTVTRNTPGTSVEVLCQDDEGDVYFDVGGVPTQWDADPAPDNICRYLSITHTSSDFEAGDQVELAFSLPAGTYDQPAVENIDFRLGSSTSMVDGDVIATDRLGAQIGTTQPPSIVLVPADTDGTLTFTTLEAGNTDSIRAYCTDSTGQVLVAMDGLGLTGSTGFNYGSASCFSVSGMSATSPSTWVRPFVSGFRCLALELLLPEDGYATGWVDDQREALESTPPFSLLVVGVDFADELADEIENPTNGPECYGVDLGGDGFDADVCPGQAAGVALDSSTRSLIALLFIAPSALGIVSHARSLLRSA